MMLAWECGRGGSVELAGVVKFSVKFMLVKDISQREFSTSSNHLVVVVFTGKKTRFMLILMKISHFEIRNKGLCVCMSRLSWEQKDQLISLCK